MSQSGHQTSASLLLQKFAQLVEFRRYSRPAVRLFRMPFEIILMILFGWKKTRWAGGRQIGDFGDDRGRETRLGGGDRGLRGGSLRGIGDEDPRAVLRPVIGTLAIHRGGIVDVKEDVEQFRQIDSGGIVALLLSLRLAVNWCVEPISI